MLIGKLKLAGKQSPYLPISMVLNEPTKLRSGSVDIFQSKHGNLLFLFLLSKFGNWKGEGRCL